MENVFINGEFVHKDEAKISVFDRGFLMADAVYEVTMVLDGALVDFDPHMARLSRSLESIGMKMPYTEAEFREFHERLVAENDVVDGLIYLQVTRGEGPRDFLIDPNLTPNTIMFSAPYDVPQTPPEISVITVDDMRWRRREIKTTQLLGASLAKTQAVAEGANDAWLCEDGFVNEGTSNNAYIVKNGEIITHQLDSDILHGITRASILQIAREHQLKVVERRFSIEEAETADEAFMTAATAVATSVVKINGKLIGDGKAGPIATALRAAYLRTNRPKS